ncbi:transcriptional regulator containing a DNA-binding HTH domain and an aminotransferase domain (MocR family) protein [Paenibacillus terrae HPL-003]|uniref:Transcriptional regulator containing a DNA-binding HTH domain and an aminotransferase domain (MocR family) protein n=1 Tax=Paenibacillus terrae (strain HPL-003) TaxID=985665 RepID=G7VYK4_PAETH|nr:PLP-dependent aminotransferase family protein [Paenibacillus terrae]AET58994.1 transcriptional regulator containing a DNA-binding HTH domain and an aminotransferase domain (MocR family) protein [Paenibacillus terrae HPL-003]
MDITIAYQRAIQMYHHKYLALYHALREGILNGSLASGTRLPSSRDLAVMYEISRGSVAEAYDMLLAGGYVETTVGRGTFVIEQTAMLPDKSQMDEQNRQAPSVKQTPPALSAWGQRIMQMERESQPSSASAVNEDEAPQPLISFQAGEVVLEGSSQTAWKSAMAAAGKDLQKPSSALMTAPVNGDEWLREAICQHVGRTRGIAAHPDQVVLCSGSMEVITLLCQLLINEQDPIVLENPCYPGIHRAVTASGGLVQTAEMDQLGIIPQDWDSSLLFVTPGRQFPTGAVLPLARRQHILQWAVSRGAWIIEDDYDSEFRWAGRPIEPLKALDRADCVIYVGSFSKSMFSSLRLGYAILPAALAQALTAAKRLYDPLPPARLEQRALARFMMRGDYVRHLRRMTRMYRSRYDVLQREMQQLSGLFHWHQTDCGLHAYAIWKHEPAQYHHLMQAARSFGVTWRDAADYQLTPGPPSACFIFAHLTEHQIIEGIHRLRQAWDNIKK